ncbi:MAG: response regulator transcription factor [Burkholderiaceae bacterium]
MTQAMHSERPHLLLADDDITFCQVLAKAIEARGFDVETVHDGASALRRIDESAPEYAIVDMHLPDMSGLKLIERLKAVDEHTNVVLLTGYASIATAIEAIKLGATYYLMKPSTPDQIVAAFDHKKPDTDIAPAAKPLSVDRLEWEHIQAVLARLGGSISATARALNMHRRTLQRKLNKHAPRPI